MPSNSTDLLLMKWKDQWGNLLNKTITLLDQVIKQGFLSCLNYIKKLTKYGPIQLSHQTSPLKHKTETWLNDAINRQPTKSYPWTKAKTASKRGVITKSGASPDHNGKCIIERISDFYPIPFHWKWGWWLHHESLLADDLLSNEHPTPPHQSSIQ